MDQILSTKVVSEPIARKSLWSTKALQNLLLWTNQALKWSKVAKCKIIAEELQRRLIIQKKRTEAIIRLEHSDIGQLLQTGKLEQAHARIEKLYKGQCLLDAYDQIDSFCKCIAYNAKIYKYKNRSSTLKDLPSDVCEAMASLIYAASRCGELPELHQMRCLFKKKFGSEFDTVSVELWPGNRVNPQLKEKLGITLISDEVKQELIRDIVTKSNILLALTDVQDTICQNYSFLDKTFKYEQKSGRNQIQIPNSETRRITGVNCSLSKGKLSVATPFAFNIGSRNTSSGSSSRTYPMTNLATKISDEKRDGSKVYIDHSFNASVDEVNLPKGSSPCSSHVHPKLPEYDDVLAKFRRLKEEHIRRKTFKF